MTCNVDYLHRCRINNSTTTQPSTFVSTFKKPLLGKTVSSSRSVVSWRADVHVNRREKTDDHSQNLRRPLPPTRRPQAATSVPSLPVCSGAAAANIGRGWTVARSASARLCDNDRRHHLISIIGVPTSRSYLIRALCSKFTMLRQVHRVGWLPRQYISKVK